MIIPKAKKKTSGGSRRQQRHMTITSSHPAVLEAINRHQQQQENRSLHFVFLWLRWKIKVENLPLYEFLE
jgi:hypothetical protein